MDLKILSFNKTLFKKDFNMVKVLVLSIAVVLFISITINILYAGNSFNKREKSYIEHGDEYNREDLIDTYRARTDWVLGDFSDFNISNIFIIFAMPIALIAILFGEEKRKKTFEVLQAMPYT